VLRKKGNRLSPPEVISAQVKKTSSNDHCGKEKEKNQENSIVEDLTAPGRALAEKGNARW